MNRRRFLKTSMAAGVSLVCSPSAVLAATGTKATPDTVLLTLNFDGGPDFRHVFVPPYDAENPTSTTFWEARAYAHEIGPTDLAAQASRAAEYLAPDNPLFHYFGVNPNCQWLLDMFNQGDVAIINNVFASTSRDHDHSKLVLESANTEANALEREYSGWGGRLVHQCDRNIVSVTRPLRLFCYGPHPTDPLSHGNARIISAENSRSMGLYEYDSYDKDAWQLSRRGHMSRALQSYYAAKAQQLPDASPYRDVVRIQETQRHFGRMMKDSLYGQLIGDSLDNLILPQELSGLYTANASNELTSHAFGEQIASIYDVMNALAPLDTNVISADYTGWDHHRLIREAIEPALSDVFGAGKGLDTLFTVLGPLSDKLVILVYGEFGRTLVANGDNGLEHGIGNSMLVIGKQVSGGVYGELFPDSEVTDGHYATVNPAIRGLTSYKQVLGTLCEKMRPGSGEAVIPGWNTTALESGVSLGGLFG